MPDIAMCQQRKCPLKASCYRYRAVPDPYEQSYGIFYAGEDCEWHLPLDDRPTRTMEEIENE